MTEKMTMAETEKGETTMTTATKYTITEYGDTVTFDSLADAEQALRDCWPGDEIRVEVRGQVKIDDAWHDAILCDGDLAGYVVEASE